MRPFERLGVVGVVLPAGRVTDVPDADGPRGPLHQRLALPGVRESKYLADRPDIFVGIDQPAPPRMIGGDPGGQLAAILNVQQHAGQQTRRLGRVRCGTQGAQWHGRKMIYGRDPTFLSPDIHGFTTRVGGWPFCQQNKVPDSTVF